MRNTCEKSFVYFYNYSVIKVKAKNATESNRKVALHFGKGKRPDGCLLLTSRRLIVDAPNPDILIL